MVRPRGTGIVTTVRFEEEGKFCCFGSRVKGFRGFVPHCDKCAGQHIGGDAEGEEVHGHCGAEVTQ